MCKQRPATRTFVVLSVIKGRILDMHRPYSCQHTVSLYRGDFGSLQELESVCALRHQSRAHVDICPRRLALKICIDDCLLLRCIYEYDAEHTIGGKGFKEDDPPNFTGSYYSDTKGMVEKVQLLRDESSH